MTMPSTPGASRGRNNSPNQSPRRIRHAAESNSVAQEIGQQLLARDACDVPPS